MLSFHTNYQKTIYSHGISGPVFQAQENMFRIKWLDEPNQNSIITFYFAITSEEYEFTHYGLS